MASHLYETPSEFDDRSKYSDNLEGKVDLDKIEKVR